MFRTCCIAAFAVFFIAFSVIVQAASEKNAITDLAYTAQTGNVLFFTGKYQNKPIHVVRNGAIGSGNWAIYTGTLDDRVRLTIDDRKGLQEILAMDKGQRITLNQVGQERIEYRFYAPDRSFIIGSVLYKKNKRWLQGMMKTEAFAGYPALNGVTDVTKNLSAQVEIPRTKGFADWLNQGWQSFHLISPAYAGLFQDLSELARVGNEIFGPVEHEMLKGALVGAAAFTVKLVAQSSVGESVAVTSAVAAAAPLIAAVGIGVGIGLALDRVRNWADAKNLGDSTSFNDLFRSMVAPTNFSREPSPEVPRALGNEPMSRETMSERPGNNYMRPSEILKREEQAKIQQEKDDFSKEMATTDQCLLNCDVACAEKHIQNAGKLQSGYADIKLMDEARRNIKKCVADKDRLRSEQSRQRADKPTRIAPKASTDDDADLSTLHTGTALNKDEACSIAQAMASDGGKKAGPCSCTMRRNLHICSVSTNNN